MTDLGPHLERLGLEQYLDAFVGEGFESWATLLDIQESDFDALNVKLGHRRKLQRAIAEYRGISYERVVGISPHDGPPDSGRGLEGSQAGSAGGGAAPPEAKRKYRRHPKPDENAPERPPSAYVIFSNRIREEVRGEKLSFTEIAKLVGDRWQKLDVAGKESYESQANAAKERYNIQLSTYKKTDAYQEYTQYLAEFKAKHGGRSEPKRPKLDPESSGGSLSAKSLEIPPETLMPNQGHVRGGSMGSMSSSSYSAAMPSPAGIQPPPMPLQVNPGAGSFPARLTTSSSQGESPTSSQYGRDVRRRGQMSNQSSVSDESPAVRSDADALMRTAGLSLSTPPSGTPPLPAIPPSGHVSEFGASPDALSRLRYPQVLQHPGPVAFAGLASALPSYGQTIYSPTGPDNSWRTRPTEYRGYGDSTRTLQPPSPYTTAPPPGAIALPPLMPPDRLPELPQGPSPRTLPLPRASPTSQQPGMPHPVRGADPGQHIAQEHGQMRSLQSQTSAPAALDRSESDAADALAGLASGARSEQRRLSDPRQQSR